MSITTAPSNVTDNQLAIKNPIQTQELAQIGHLSRINTEKFQEVDIKGTRVEDYVSMLQANMDPKLELIWPLSTPPEPQIQTKPIANPGSSGEARKARAFGDDIEANEPENNAVVENTSHEEVSGGKRVDPTFGINQEA